MKLDDVLESLETKYPDKLKGLLPRIYAGSNAVHADLQGLIATIRALRFYLGMPAL